MLELIILIPAGLLFCFLGWSIWKKERITRIHDYHHTNVTEKDKKQYTEKMGKACVVMGCGMIVTGAVDFITKTFYGWIFFGVCFVSGLILMIYAQVKHNGGIF